MPLLYVSQHGEDSLSEAVEEQEDNTSLEEDLKEERRKKSVIFTPLISTNSQIINLIETVEDEMIDEEIIEEVEVIENENEKMEQSEERSEKVREGKDRTLSREGHMLPEPEEHIVEYSQWFSYDEYDDRASVYIKEYNYSSFEEHGEHGLSEAVEERKDNTALEEDLKEERRKKSVKVTPLLSMNSQIINLIETEEDEMIVEEIIEEVEVIENENEKMEQSEERSEKVREGKDRTLSREGHMLPEPEEHIVEYSQWFSDDEYDDRASVDIKEYNYSSFEEHEEHGLSEVVEERKDNTALEEDLKEERRNKTALEEALEEERRAKTALEEVLEEERRNKTALEEALEEERRAKTALEEALEEERRNKTALEEALEEERRNKTALEEVVEEGRRTKTALEKSLKDKRKAEVALKETLEKEVRAKAALEEALANAEKATAEQKKFWEQERKLKDSLCVEMEFMKAQVADLQESQKEYQQQKAKLKNTITKRTVDLEEGKKVIEKLKNDLEESSNRHKKEAAQREEVLYVKIKELEECLHEKQEESQEKENKIQSLYSNIQTLQSDSKAKDDTISSLQETADQRALDLKEEKTKNCLLQRDYEAAVSQQNKDAGQLNHLTQENQQLISENKRQQDLHDSSLKKREFDQKQVQEEKNVCTQLENDLTKEKDRMLRAHKKIQMQKEELFEKTLALEKSLLTEKYLRSTLKKERRRYEEVVLQKQTAVDPLTILSNQLKEASASSERLMYDLQTLKMENADIRAKFNATQTDYERIKAKYRALSESHEEMMSRKSGTISKLQCVVDELKARQSENKTRQTELEAALKHEKTRNSDVQQRVKEISSALDREKAASEKHRVELKEALTKLIETLEEKQKLAVDLQRAQDNCSLLQEQQLAGSNSQLRRINGTWEMKPNWSGAWGLVWALVPAPVGSSGSGPCCVSTGFLRVPGLAHS
uniref:myosin-2 heavy chain, non muscle-like n=1 Tax=Scatophagus argus TaxID=75038 RepID=UPI001ED828B3|nr:myosin-2 heavy chain, non muscle-like [Scatophagus argus]